MAKEDIRGKIAACVGFIGFDEAKVGLSAHEKMTLVMCKNWLFFIESEGWMGVRDGSVADNVKPILADSLLVGKHLEEAYDNGEGVRVEQLVLFDEKVRVAKEAEENFFNGIFKQRDQEINQHMIKKKALMPKSLSKRKAEKEAKAAMLAKSMVKNGNVGNDSALPVKVEVMDGPGNEGGESVESVEVVEGSLEDKNLELGEGSLETFGSGGSGGGEEKKEFEQ